MWDQATSRSRGYGFVAFREKGDAERAMQEMSGQSLGNRAIRCNWANQKSSKSSSSNVGSASPPSGAAPAQKRSNNYEEVLAQAPATNTTVYIGNIPADTVEVALYALFAPFGEIEEVRIQQGRCFGFLRFHTHEQAANAILGSADMAIAGQRIRCSWGKQKFTEQAPTAYSQMYHPQYYAQGSYPVYPPYYPQTSFYQAPNPSFYGQAYDPFSKFPLVSSLGL